MSQKLWESSSDQKKNLSYGVMNSSFQKNLKKTLIKNMKIF